jgi:uncharacterized glyoxalase superfamily protein PhnB
VKKRTGQAWMPAARYSESLVGLGVNLLVADVSVALAFQTEVLGATTAYADADFAAVEGYGSSWCLHADHTYGDHPLSGVVAGLNGRGPGVELRVHGCDPDAAEARAREHGYTVLAGASDRPHGLREAYLIDADGYCWVPDVTTSTDL